MILKNDDDPPLIEVTLFPCRSPSSSWSPSLMTTAGCAAGCLSSLTLPTSFSFLLEPNDNLDAFRVSRLEPVSCVCCWCACASAMTEARSIDGICRHSNPPLISRYCTCIRSNTRRMSILMTPGGFVDVVATLTQIKNDQPRQEQSNHSTKNERAPKQTLEIDRLNSRLLRGYPLLPLRLRLIRLEVSFLALLFFPFGNRRGGRRVLRRCSTRLRPTAKRANEPQPQPSSHRTPPLVSPGAAHGVQNGRSASVRLSNGLAGAQREARATLNVRLRTRVDNFSLFLRGVRVGAWGNVLFLPILLFFLRHNSPHFSAGSRATKDARPSPKSTILAEQTPKLAAQRATLARMLLLRVPVHLLTVNMFRPPWFSLGPIPFALTLSKSCASRPSGLAPLGQPTLPVALLHRARLIAGARGPGVRAGTVPPSRNRWARPARVAPPMLRRRRCGGRQGRWRGCAYRAIVGGM